MAEGGEPAVEAHVAPAQRPGLRRLAPKLPAPGVLVLTRGRPRLQATGVIALGVVLFALALVVPTIAQPTLPALLPGLGF